MPGVNDNQWLRAIAAETVEIVRRGGYPSPSGAPVDIGDDVASAVAGTRMYAPGEPLPETDTTAATPLIEVTAESTLAAARRLGAGVAALVFASARNPGGGFRTGARAQEEDIARSSALHACLAAVPEFYEHHRRTTDLRYSDRVIYSPGVPVFRDDRYQPLDEPAHVSLITAAAPNRQALLRNQPELADSVSTVLSGRAERVLRVAATHKHRRLVLGAWGCGVFGNDPHAVADTFARGLDRVAAFDHVVFAILDRTPDSPTRRAFADRLLP